MIVAARAADRESEEAASYDVHTIVPLVGARDFDGAVVVIPGSEPEHPGRGQRAMTLLFIEQIAGNLNLDELVVRQIVIQRLNDPVAIHVCVRIGIETSPHRVETTVVVFAEARHIEPDAAPTLSIVGRGKQPVDHLGECVRRFVLFEGTNLFRCGRQTDQIERRAPDEVAPACRGHRRNTLFLEAGKHKAIDGVLIHFSFFTFGGAGFFKA